jgi:hypothetical protein
MDLFFLKKEPKTLALRGYYELYVSLVFQRKQVYTFYYFDLSCMYVHVRTGRLPLDLCLVVMGMAVGVAEVINESIYMVPF